MALKLAKKSVHDVTVEYWKITQTLIDWHSRSAVVVLHGWVSEGARRSNKAPLEMKRFVTGDFPFSFDANVVQDAYAVIKADEDFVGAVDC